MRKQKGGWDLVFTNGSSKIAYQQLTGDFRGSKMRGTFDHQMRNFLLFDFVSRNIC